MNETREEKEVTGGYSDLACAGSVVAYMTFLHTPKVLYSYTLKNASRWPSTSALTKQR